MENDVPNGPNQIINTDHNGRNNEIPCLAVIGLNIKSDIVDKSMSEEDNDEDKLLFVSVQVRQYNHSLCPLEVITQEEDKSTFSPTSKTRFEETFVEQVGIENHDAKSGNTLSIKIKNKQMEQFDTNLTNQASDEQVVEAVVVETQQMPVQEPKIIENDCKMELPEPQITGNGVEVTGHVPEIDGKDSSGQESQIREQEPRIDVIKSKSPEFVINDIVPEVTHTEPQITEVKSLITENESCLTSEEIQTPEIDSQITGNDVHITSEEIQITNNNSQAMGNEIQPDVTDENYLKEAKCEPDVSENEPVLPKNEPVGETKMEHKIKTEPETSEYEEQPLPGLAKDNVNGISNGHSSSSSKSRSHYSSSSSHHRTSRDHSSSHKDHRSSRHYDSDGGRSKSRSSSSSSSRSHHKCLHKPEEKCRCRSSSSRTEPHQSKHESNKKNAKVQCRPEDIAHESIPYNQKRFPRVPWMPHPQLSKLKYGRFYRIELDVNGGASIVHLYMDEIQELSPQQLEECAVEFIKLSYSEDANECAYHVMGVVHGAAAYLPDLVDYMADHYPSLIVKTGSLASRDNHTTTMSEYRDEVYKTYSHGSFRYPPLDQLSICGVLGEEVGAYFPDFVARLEQSPFMKPVMPWSTLSVVQTDNPRESNDGPIFWVRPGEQMIPANEALKEGGRPKKRRNNELDNLVYIGTHRLSEARESLFMDRTKAHADQIGVDGGVSNTAPTAAVGVLKSVNCGHPEHGDRATKDVVAFHAEDYTELLEILMLDLYEPPQTQCTKWIEVSKLNSLRREGIRYAHVQLHDNDVYYLPRKIIHQFQTISSVASVAWHIRYKEYFTLRGAPNLHIPTGINKGQVFYEKKDVAVYCPPICDNDLNSDTINESEAQKTPKKSEELKKYSPFKHSPRKYHKSYPTTPKKDDTEKKDDGVSPVKKQDGVGSVKKQDTVNSPVRKHDGVSPVKKHDEVGRSPDEGKKDSSNHNSHHHHHRRCSSDKKESRREVKNLDSELTKSEKEKPYKKHESKHKHEKETEKLRNGSEHVSKRKHDDEGGAATKKVKQEVKEGEIAESDSAWDGATETDAGPDSSTKDNISLPSEPTISTAEVPNTTSLMPPPPPPPPRLSEEERMKIRLRRKKFLMKKMAQDKSKTYDLLGDIMAQMDKQ